MGHKRIFKYIALLLVAVFVFNLGLRIGILLMANNNQSTISTVDDSSSSQSKQNDETFINDLRDSLQDQAEVLYYQSERAIHVLPTSQDMIQALDEIGNNATSKQYWNDLVDSFAEISNYTTMDIYLVNPYDNEYMLLWVKEGQVKYNFLDENDIVNDVPSNI